MLCFMLSAFQAAILCVVCVLLLLLLAKLIVLECFYSVGGGRGREPDVAGGVVDTCGG